MFYSAGDGWIINYCIYENYKKEKNSERDRERERVGYVKIHFQQFSGVENYKKTRLLRETD